MFLILFIILFFVSGGLIDPTHSEDLLQFQQITTTAPWSPRFSSHFLTSKKMFSYTYDNTSLIAPVGSLILIAGSKDLNYYTLINDLWLSTNQGFAWVKLSNQHESLIFPTVPSGSFCSDNLSNYTYTIPYGNALYNSSHPPPIWATTSLTNWSKITPIFYHEHNSSLFNHSPLLDRYGSVCFIDSQSNIYYMLGRNMSHVKQPWQTYSDTWWSVDHGQTWNLRTTSLNFSSRYKSLTDVHFNNSHLGNVDLFYILGGVTANNLYTFDLWVSTDQASTWSLVNPYIFNTIIDFASLRITRDGILVLASVADTSSPRTQSEIWTSLDGGLTWYKCLSYAEYGPRITPALTFDAEGYIYVSGGVKSGIFYSDVWKSNISVYNWTQWAKTCGTVVPEAGVGLSIWPPKLINHTSSSSSSSTALFHSSSSISSSSSSTFSSSISSSSSSTFSSSISSSSSSTFSSSISSSSSSTFSSSSSSSSTGSTIKSSSSSSSTGYIEIPNHNDWVLYLVLVIVILAVITLLTLLLYLLCVRRKYGRIKWICCDNFHNSELNQDRLLNESELQ